jgi:hypothetical protein
MADTDAFFTPPPITDYTLQPAPDGDLLTFQARWSRRTNRTTRCGAAISAPNAGAAILVMPQ